MCLYELLFKYWHDYVNEPGDGKSQLYTLACDQPYSSIFEGLNGLSHKFQDLNLAEELR